MSNQTPRQTLPHAVEALRCCQQQAVVQGEVALSALPRLAAQLQLTDEARASVVLAFRIDEQGRRCIAGTVVATLPLQCQRCLEVVDVPVSSELALALVWSDEQAAQLSRTLDPVLMTAPELDLYALVEEELLLALPLVPQHPVGQCAAPAAAQDELPAQPVRDNPFQVLANLKTHTNNADH